MLEEALRSERKKADGYKELLDLEIAGTKSKLEVKRRECRKRMKDVIEELKLARHELREEAIKAKEEAAQRADEAEMINEEHKREMAKMRKQMEIQRS